MHKKKKVLIVSEFMRNIEELDTNNSRFLYLARKLINTGDYEVDIITSSFSHGMKRHFTLSQAEYYSIPIYLVEEPGYEKNVSIKRLWSHRQLGKNVLEFLQGREIPDLIYLAMPSIDLANSVCRYAKEMGIKVIIDIQDLWPEAFRLKIKNKLRGDILFKPMELQADRVYESADGLVAVSKTYLQRGMKHNSKTHAYSVTFLGTDLNDLETSRVAADPSEYIAEFQRSELKLAYVGTLSYSYNMNIVLDALKQLNESRPDLNYTFFVFGDGPMRSEFEQKAEENGIKSRFFGRLDYPLMMNLLQRCDIAVNPIQPGAAQSIVNKHGDYCASHLPILSTQDSAEFRELIETYQMGFNCDPIDPSSLMDNIVYLYDNPVIRKQMGEQAYKCAIERFDRQHSYESIVQMIDKLITEN